MNSVPRTDLPTTQTRTLLGFILGCLTRGTCDFNLLIDYLSIIILRGIDQLNGWMFETIS